MNKKCYCHPERSEGSSRFRDGKILRSRSELSCVARTNNKRILVAFWANNLFMAQVRVSLSQ